MFEYEIWNKATNETVILFGYNVADAFRRSTIKNTPDWIVLVETYVD